MTPVHGDPLSTPGAFVAASDVVRPAGQTESYRPASVTVLQFSAEAIYWVSPSTSGDDHHTGPGRVHALADL